MKKGFTLLEMLIALVLFTIGVVLIVGLFGHGLTGSLDAENTTIAMNLGQGKMEEIRNLAYTDIASEAKDDVSGFSGFQRDVVVTEPQTGLKQVVVTTYWTFKGSTVSIPIQTYIPNN